MIVIDIDETDVLLSEYEDCIWYMDEIDIQPLHKIPYRYTQELNDLVMKR